MKLNEQPANATARGCHSSSDGIRDRDWTE